MSNGRRGAYGNAYRTGYLRSVVWFVRRDRWFREETLREAMTRCSALHAELAQNDDSSSCITSTTAA